MRQREVSWPWAADRFRIGQTHIPNRTALHAGSVELFAGSLSPDSLAGRVETVELLPFSQAEIVGTQPSSFVDRAFAGDFAALEITGPTDDLTERVVRGGFPEALSRSAPARHRSWLRNYARVIAEHDVREIARVSKRGTLPRLIDHAAAAAGGLLNMSGLGTRLGVDGKTVDRWLTLLEHMFLIRRVHAWHRSQIAGDCTPAGLQGTETSQRCRRRQLRERDPPARRRPHTADCTRTVCNARQDALGVLSAPGPTLRRRPHRLLSAVERADLIARAENTLCLRCRIRYRRVMDQADDSGELRDIVIDIRNELTGLKTEVTGLGNELTGLKTQVTGLEGEVAEGRNETAELRSELTGFGNELTGLKTEVAEGRNETAGLKTLITESRNETAELKTLITESRNETAELRSELTEFRGEVGERFDHVDHEMRLIKTRVGAIQIETSALIDTVADLNKRGGT